MIKDLQDKIDRLEMSQKTLEKKRQLSKLVDITGSGSLSSFSSTLGASTSSLSIQTLATTNPQGNTLYNSSSSSSIIDQAISQDLIIINDGNDRVRKKSLVVSLSEKRLSTPVGQLTGDPSTNNQMTVSATESSLSPTLSSHSSTSASNSSSSNTSPSSSSQNQNNQPEFKSVINTTPTSTRRLHANQNTESKVTDEVHLETDA